MIRLALKDISRSALEARYKKILPLYESYLEDAHARLLALLEASCIRFTLKRRMKSFDSAFDKILRKAKELGPPKGECKKDETSPGGEAVVLITDFMGIRVICPFVEDIVKVEDLIRRSFEVVERERKGEEYSPREFGYESIHLIIKIADKTEIEHIVQEELLCEIQLRTILQEAWAEVEHELLYKAEFTPFDEPIRRRLAAVNANLSLVDTIFQEIRDYQRRLQDELKKRRESFFEHLDSLDLQPRPQDIPPPLIKTPLDEERGGADFSVSLVESDDNLLLEALSAHNQRLYAEAAVLYTKLLSRRLKDSVRAMILIHRGMAYFGSSRYDPAIEDFSASLELDPANARAYYYRGVVYRFLKDPRRALADFDRCITLDPYQFDPVFGRAQIYFSLGDYVLSHEDCARALDLRPDSAPAKRFLEVVKSRMQF